MILAMRDLIATRDLLYVPKGNPLVIGDPETPTTLVLGESSEIISVYAEMAANTVRAFQNVTDAKKATAIFEEHFKRWAKFRRDYRHQTTVQVAADQTVSVMEVDNLYLDRKTIGASTVLWKYGMTHFNPKHLDGWSPQPPTGWMTYRWGALAVN